MAYLNVAAREWNAKLVYWGPGLSGKSANLKALHERALPGHRGKLLRLATETQQPASFDFLPLSVGDLHGIRTRFYVYTTPGHIHFDKDRSSILADADGVVFVADSHPERAQANVWAMHELVSHLAPRRREGPVPLIVQINKRDLSYAAGTQEVCESLGIAPEQACEAVAARGEGVWETFLQAAREVLLQHPLEGPQVHVGIKS